MAFAVNSMLAVNNMQNSRLEKINFLENLANAKKNRKIFTSARILFFFHVRKPPASFSILKHRNNQLFYGTEEYNHLRDQSNTIMFRKTMSIYISF